jgi:hypothetical protein
MLARLVHPVDPRDRRNKPDRPKDEKGNGQPNCDTSHPANGEKMPTAKYCADANSEDARPLSDLGNHITVTRAFAGKLGASTKPSTNRSVKMTATAPAAPLTNSPTKPSTKVDSDQITSVMR